MACAIALAGCTTGDTERDGDDDSGAPIVLEKDLDLGGIEPEASDVPKTAGDLANGRAVEARRLAEIVVDPATLDDRFQAAGLPTGPVASPAQLTRAFSSEDPQLFKDRISGAGARRFLGSATDDDIDMSIVVMSFTDAATAARVVDSIGDKNERDSINPIVGTMTYGSRTTLPGHPDVRASLFRVERGDTDPSLAGLAAYGDLAVFMFVTGRPGKLPLARSLMSKAFTEQRAALDGFTSTPLAELGGLPVDEDGHTKLALAVGEGSSTDQEPDVPYVWGPDGALLQQTWAGTLPDAFERADLDVMVQAGSNVYRTGSSKQAARLLDDFEETMTQTQYREHDAPKGLRDARCYEGITGSSILAPNVCQVQYGRYVAEAAGTTARDAQARISAQYLLLQDVVGT